MSFPRHKEIYPCDGGTISATVPLLIAVDESPAGYSWRVVLQQSPLPLHQPRSECATVVLPVEKFAANGEQCLIQLSQPTGPPQLRMFKMLLQTKEDNGDGFNRQQSSQRDNPFCTRFETKANPLRKSRPHLPWFQTCRRVLARVLKAYQRCLQVLYCVTGALVCDRLRPLG